MSRLRSFLGALAAGSVVAGISCSEEGSPALPTLDSPPAFDATPLSPEAAADAPLDTTDAEVGDSATDATDATVDSDARGAADGASDGSIDGDGGGAG